MRAGVPDAYELISDGRLVALGDKKYLLSPQDLAGLEVLPELIRGGVASLKIEGRLKTPEYVANITRVYRESLDKLRGENGQSGENASDARKAEIGNRKYELEMAFSRGLYNRLVRRHRQPTTGSRALRKKARCFPG